MASATEFPATVVSDNSNAGVDAWEEPQDAAADGGGVASVGSTTGLTEYLKATDFGFAVPLGATIDGVEVAVEKMEAFSGVTFDVEVRLVKGGTVAGDNKADLGDPWQAGMEVKTYGGAADLWGLALTPADVNASNFGVVISCEDPFTGANPQVDYMSITVHYTEAAASGFINMTLLGAG